MSTCYLYFYDGHLSVSPTTISLARAMGKIFDKVVVFCKNTSFARYEFEEENVESHYMNDDFLFNRKIGRTRFFIGVLKYMFKQGISKDDMFVCIDDRPLKYVNLIYKWFKIPFVFLALELFTDKKHSKSEIESFRNAKAILIQEQRLKNLLDIYKSSDLTTPYFWAPNVSIGEDKADSDLESMVSQFEIPQGKTKCASIGMISKYVYSKEISKAFSSVENAVLIYHNRNKIDTNSDEIKEIIEENGNKNLYLSQKVYDFNDIGYVYDGIDIGIAAYMPAGDGFDFIGHASGKLTFYLKYKKPVIVNKLDGYSDIVEKYDCGVIVEDVNSVSQWQNAVNKINANYEYYSENAHKCYLEEFDFSSKIQPFVDYVQKIICK